MRNNTLLASGVVGTMIAAVCCFTPILAILLGAVGLAAVVGWLDYVLFPAMAIFLGIVACALLRRSRDDRAINHHLP